LLLLLAFNVLDGEPVIFAELHMEFDLLLKMEYLLSGLDAKHQQGLYATVETPTLPISAMFFDLYEANAFARAKCIFISVL
jgi:hypothetical protein